jgi:hypothetical protein
MRKSIVILCVILFPAFVLGQSTFEQQFMQLLRVYERSQDSVFAPGNNNEKRLFLAKSAENADKLYQKLILEEDTNLLNAAKYMKNACQMYAWVNDVGATLVVAPKHDGQPNNGQTQNGQPQVGQPQGLQPQVGQPQGLQPQVGQPQGLPIRAAMEKYDSTTFPIKFKIMGVQIILRYENIKPDLYLYYDVLGNEYLTQKNRKGMRYVANRYRFLGDKNKADYWRKKGRFILNSN